MCVDVLLQPDMTILQLKEWVATQVNLKAKQIVSWNFMKIRFGDTEELFGFLGGDPHCET